eukprot:TRINITY_DN143_c1_g1_i2.p2 TRINITY_DN143_c1_g1~~TRINITY_DN143_c1_g1_i2.p2  ORF type:complete len:416 (+),score=91.40 TRINITY_DN143_c1_g1_i2:148-1248(+)
MEDYPAIAVDLGSCSIKAGFSGDDVPKVVIPSLVTTDSKTCFADGIPYDDNSLELQSVMNGGKVENWDGLETLLRAMYTKLGRDSTDQPILLTKKLNTTKDDSKILTQILFEKFNVPALYIQNEPPLTLYSYGLTTGMVVDIGETQTQISPLYEGFALPHSQPLDIAGRNITNQLLKLMNEFDNNNLNPSSSIDKLLCRELKEKLSFICSNDEDKEEEEGKECRVPIGHRGKVYKLGNELYKCTEPLFNPGLLGAEYSSIPGIHECVRAAIQNTDQDLYQDLYHNIVLSGGSTLIRGFEDRFKKEITNVAPLPYKNTLVIRSEKDRHLSVFRGASILASLSTYKSFWLSKNYYDNCGPESIYRFHI